MRIALLIHVHTNPNQVARLVSRLRHDDVDIYINVDAKVSIDQFEDYVENVFFIKNRTKVRWGRFSQVQQILNSFKEIQSNKLNYSHILFISGADYPIKPIGEIVTFLEEHCSSSFIDYHELGSDEWSNTIKKRYEYWHFLSKYDLRNNVLVKKLLLKLGFRREYPFENVFYGSCWFCLTVSAVDFLLEFSKSNPQYISHFKQVGCADELYIQSVLLNSDIKDQCVNKIFRYFDWSENGKSPKILTEEDFDGIVNSDSWFARKLDLNINTIIFDLLDQINEEK